MKNICIHQKIIFLLTLLFVTVNQQLNSQDVAKGINYQAVLRNANNQLVDGKSINVTITIFKKEINGEIVWKETHTKTTNKLGIFTLTIGQGTKAGGTSTSFSKIQWGTAQHLLGVEVNIAGGEKISFEPTPMLSVPYAFFADSARVARADFSGVTFDPVSNTLKNSNSVIADLSTLSQTLQYDPTSYHLSITGKPGIVDLRQFAHSPQDLRFLNNKLWVTGNKDSTVVDLSPYKQTLSISATSKLQISGGNEVQVDTSNMNEIQALSLNGNKVVLSKGGGEVAIDASETNELQTLSKVGNALVLSNAPNGRAIPVDTSLNNEIQDLNLTGNTLKITGNTSATNVDLTKYLDDTDKQTLSRSGNNLAISGGNQVDVSDMINPSFIGFSGNNLSNQSLPGLTETVISWNEEFDSGNVLDNNKFNVPVNGYYNLNFNLILSTSNSLTIRVYKNTTLLRTLESFSSQSISHNMLLNLMQGDNITIRIYNSANFSHTIVSGYFSGYKVN